MAFPIARRAKFLLLKHERFINDCTFLSFSNMDSGSIGIPSIGIATNNSLQILVRNDSQKEDYFLYVIE